MSDETHLPDRDQALRGHAFNHDTLPMPGSWYWVLDEETEVLACCTNLGSNYAGFKWYDGGSTWTTRIHFNEVLARVRPEPGWRVIVEKRMEVAQQVLAARVKELGRLCQEAGLNQTQAEAATGALVPVKQGLTPEQQKKSLIHLKENSFPEARKEVDAICAEIVGIQKSLTLPQRTEMERLKENITEVDDRLFALELYAGLAENIYRVRKGSPAPQDTPVTVRQLLLYMDEECLIDYDKGGMDFEKLEDFDAWVARPENADRIVPEPRCLVAMQVRRNDKNYGLPRTIYDVIQNYERNKRNKYTYLLIRNGDQMWRLLAEVDFSPRLIPLRDEFNGELRTQGRYNFKRGEYDEEVITKDSVEFDDVMAGRKQQVRHYNRTMFLLQGLLDRSAVYHPHPPINLGDPDDVDHWLRLVRDEEDALPSAGVPEWEVYRDALNSTVRKGSYVWCNVGYETWGGYTRDKHRPKYGYDARHRPTVCQVSKVSRDRKVVTLRWELGDKITTRRVVDTTRPYPGKPGYYYTKAIETNHGMRYGTQKVPMRLVFAVQAYTPGDYKKFLCDRALKGRYLEWAPALLGAEDWLRDQKSGSVDRRMDEDEEYKIQEMMKDED